MIPDSPPPIRAPTGRRHPGRQPLRSTDGVRLARRGAFLALLWAAISGADPGAWLVGVPTVLGALWAWTVLVPRGSGLSPAGALRFLPYFALESVKGGVDVAARVLGPRLRVQPGIRPYGLRLASPAARVFFADAVSLLPGTLTADLAGDRVLIHALDGAPERAADLDRELARLECRVADLFGEPPRDLPGGGQGAEPHGARPTRHATTH